ncbi:MAG: hypothetical protein A3H57_03570 [Candidatus Taylorbacteria bacterium RIFCSPLOWO2_02_FULL_43_11]|uniref:Uncharacterized protein n=1 Tax=Candidatus Taylorbacteria bacterium RIFCSPHIGHO2_02_FULL_43_32b TaxID=1802306 RepID=A0A1G2MKK0_9BACT|nr:MAG: hypothetical protein A3C72_02225 [Candidatus Taylorbacteria bacterium RIFCSPHIGHO2_02_FULL_43_32b]OHA31712.1 MAG: hypothetical protein A3B08_01950 [Candidatus Taylorbacteria bacterium RIFCSPLOWO2_01_FULL_43_44]OHA36625.1 MAG: hypothetical protein A3H57_03570 [Candidatus Taylorbacteria bacterium RIFCSPLOWO2_02_FULL_43_11]
MSPRAGAYFCSASAEQIKSFIKKVTRMIATQATAVSFDLEAKVVGRVYASKHTSKMARREHGCTGWLYERDNTFSEVFYYGKGEFRLWLHRNDFFLPSRICAPGHGESPSGRLKRRKESAQNTG